MTDILVGIDGGGSKTRIIVADETGWELAEAVGGRSAMRPGEADQSAGIIAALVKQALAEAGAEAIKPKVLVAGVAGVGRQLEQRALTAALEDFDLAEDVVVAGDGVLRLAMKDQERGSDERRSPS